MSQIPSTSDTTADKTSTIHAVEKSVFEFLSNKYILAFITIAPTLLLLSFIILVPIGWAIYAGFHEIPIFSPNWEWVGLENYYELLSSPEFHKAVWRSVVFAGGSVVFQLIVGTGLALLVNRSFRFDTVVRAIVMLPYLVPTAVLGFIALWMGNSQWGIINQVLLQLGLIDSAIAWYGSLSLAMPALILTNSWKFSIFVTIMVLARLQSIPEGYYEAAEMCGANTFQKFRDITLPNLKGVIFIVLLLRGVWMFNKFDIIWVLTSGGPGEATTTAPIYAYKVAFNQSSLGMAAAISTALFVLLVAVAIVYFAVLKPAEGVRVE